MHGKQLELSVLHFEPVCFVREPWLAAEKAQNDAERFVLPVAQDHWVDCKGVGVRRQSAWSRAEYNSATRHVIQLNNSLSDIEWVMIRQRHDTSSQTYSRGSLTCSGQKHLRTSNHFPTRTVMFPAPEFTKPKLFQLNDEI